MDTAQSTSTRRLSVAVSYNSLDTSYMNEPMDRDMGLDMTLTLAAIALSH